MPAHVLENLLKYDTIHGRFQKFKYHRDGGIYVGDKCVALSHETSPATIPWHKYDVDCVIEASGMFKTRAALQQHIGSGARRVLLSQPSADALDRSVVIGINEYLLSANDTIISNASCTTNCLAPVLKVLCDEFSLQKAFFNTVHPFTNNQSLMDGPHADLRRSRSAFCNIIPTTSTAVDALKPVMPELTGKVDGFATRVPVALGSYIEISALLGKQATVESINEAFVKAAANLPTGIMEYCQDPIVSSDIIGNTHSAIIDSLCTKVLGGDFAQVLAWYDNETAYSNRLIDVLRRWYTVV